MVVKRVVEMADWESVDPSEDRAVMEIGAMMSWILARDEVEIPVSNVVAIVSFLGDGGTDNADADASRREVICRATVSNGCCC